MLFGCGGPAARGRVRSAFGRPGRGAAASYSAAVTRSGQCAPRLLRLPRVVRRGMALPPHEVVGPTTEGLPVEELLHDVLSFLPRIRDSDRTLIRRVGHLGSCIPEPGGMYRYVRVYTYLSTIRGLFVRTSIYQYVLTQEISQTVRTCMYCLVLLGT